MSKVKIFVPILLVSLTLITGCSIDSKPASDASQVKGDAIDATAQNNRPAFQEMFADLPAINISEVNVGSQVMVLGTENSDGSVAANIILVGESVAEFAEMMASRGKAFEDRTNRPADFTPPPGFTPGQGRGSGRRMAGMGMNQSMVRLSGEVLSKEQDNLVIKLEETGSKLIFFSENTEVKAIDLE